MPADYRPLALLSDGIFVELGDCPRGLPPVLLGGVAAKRSDAPVEALELKMLHDEASVINVRLTGDPGC